MSEVGPINTIDVKQVLISTTFKIDNQTIPSLKGKNMNDKWDKSFAWEITVDYLIIGISSPFVHNTEFKS